jgi:hypothetical protein
MNVIQRNTTIGPEVSVFIRDWFTPEPDEPIQATTSERNDKLDESREPTHPVWNGELDEPIWW